MSERDKTAAVKRNSPAREIWRRFKKNKAAMLGLGIFSVMVLLAVFADVICDYDTQVIAQDVANRLKAPSSAHWFGTDAYGRDIFARVVHGARISIIIGLAATVGSVCISGILGSIAGYYGGRIIGNQRFGNSIPDRRRDGPCSEPDQPECEHQGNPWAGG